MQSAFDEHTKDIVLEKWNRDDDSAEQVDSLHEQVAEIATEIVKKLKVPNASISAWKSKIEARLTKLYFFENKKPRLAKIVDEGIQKEVNMDDCDMQEVFHIVAITEFLENPELFLPKAVVSEVDIPSEYDDF